MVLKARGLIGVSERVVVFLCGCVFLLVLVPFLFYLRLSLRYHSLSGWLAC